VDASQAGSTGSKTTGISVAIDNTARGGVAQQTMNFAVKYLIMIAAAAN
jgi:hypothetical protein